MINHNSQLNKMRLGIVLLDVILTVGCRYLAGIYSAVSR